MFQQRLKLDPGDVSTDTPSDAVAAGAPTPVLSRLSMRRISVVSLLGLVVVILFVAWLAVNLEKTPTDFFEAFFIGLANGCVYALVALGYTLVYGILELINFAHGDVFMLGGMISVQLAVSFGLKAGAADLWPLVLVVLAVSMISCALINATIEFVAYRPLRNAPRLAPLI